MKLFKSKKSKESKKLKDVYVLKKEEHYTPNGMSISYYIEKNGEFIRNSVCFDEEKAKDYFEKIKNGLFRDNNITEIDKFEI